MKVLFATNMFPDQNTASRGIFVKSQFESLVNAGTDIDVLYIPTYRGKLSYFELYFELLKRIKKNKYDLIHAHYGLTGFVCNMQRKVPVITTFYGSDIELKSQLVFSRIAYRMSASAIVQLEKHKNLLGQKSVVIPCGVDTKRFCQLDQNESRQKLGLSTDKKYLLFPSSKKREEKNYPLFANSLKLLRQMNPGADELSLENIKDEEIPLYYNAADVVVFTSLHEGSPIVIREALACGTPIVSVDVGDVRKWISDVEGCHIVPSDPETIAGQVAEVLRNTKKISPKIEISLENTAESILGFYSETIERMHE